MIPMSKKVKLTLFFRCLTIFNLFIILFRLPTFATEASEKSSFSFNESLGLIAVAADKVDTAPVLDGIISEGEYVSKVEFTIAQGLSLTADSGEVVSSNYLEQYSDVKENVSVSYDDEYFYVAIDLSINDGKYTAFYHQLHGNVYSFAISLGVDPLENVAARSAALRNVYYFASSSKEAIAVTGARISFINGELRNELKISSSLKALKNNGYTDKNDVLWNGEKYCKESKFVCNENKSAASFECRIPVGDVLLSLSEEKREEVLGLLQNEEEFCGSFMAQASLAGMPSSSLMACTAVSAKDFCSYDDGKTWNEALIADFGIAPSTAYAIDYLMAPLSFGGRETSSPGNDNDDAPAQNENVDKDGTAVNNNVNNDNASDNVLVQNEEQNTESNLQEQQKPNSSNSLPNREEGKDGGSEGGNIKENNQTESNTKEENEEKDAAEQTKKEETIKPEDSKEEKINEEDLVTILPNSEYEIMLPDDFSEKNASSFDHDAFEDESVFEELPDADDNLPEHTEIIPLDSEDDGSTENVLGTVVPFLAAVLMLVSVIAVAFIFFKIEKEEKNAEKTKKTP